MPVSFEGEDTTVSFNPRFILDPLKSITRDKISFEFRDDMSPGVFKVDDESKNNLSFLCVVMPIRTD